MPNGRRREGFSLAKNDVFKLKCQFRNIFLRRVNKLDEAPNFYNYQHHYIKY